MFRSAFFGAPQKCPNRNCRAQFYKDSHKGWLPKSQLEVYAVMRCPVCRDTFCVSQMINMVHEYKESLPARDLPKNKITIFDTNDQGKFRQELFAEDNPLMSLYDGYYPGAPKLPNSETD
jgi:hypothetical protein